VADGDVSNFGTDKWIPRLSELCFNYQRNLQLRQGGQYLRFKDELLGTSENPGVIVESYHASVNRFKRDIYDIFAMDAHIDHHKIAALYLQSFLIHQPFINDIPEQTKNPKLNMYAMCPNEYFAIPFLTTVFMIANDKWDHTLKLPLAYMNNLIKLLHYYKNNINNYEPAALSNMFYLIEQLYFKKK
jgi:hypothetical protein